MYINTTISYTCEWNNLLCEAERIYICNVCYILHSKLQEAGDYNFYTSLHAISRFCSPNLKVIFVGALSKETNIGVSGNIASGNIISDNGMFIHQNFLNLNDFTWSVLCFEMWRTTLYFCVLDLSYVQLYKNFMMNIFIFLRSSKNNIIFFIQGNQLLFDPATRCENISAFTVHRSNIIQRTTSEL